MISGARRCGIQTVVISLLVHRLFHKHKGILSLFAVHDTHQTVIVMVNDYALDFKRQFWPDKNYSRGYKGKNISYCSVVPHAARLLLLLLSDASLLQRGSANRSVKACNGLNLSKICCSIQNCHKGDRIGDDGPVGYFSLIQANAFPCG